MDAEARATGGGVSTAGGGRAVEALAPSDSPRCLDALRYKDQMLDPG